MLEFDSKNHKYHLDSVEIPSVTTILKHEGYYNYDSIPNAILEFAGHRGDCVHKLTEYYDKGTLDDGSVDKRLLPYLRAWQKFCKDYNVSHELIEEKVFSRIWKFAGTLDRISTGTFSSDKREKALIDVKTTSSCVMATGLQLGAYKLAWKELKGETIDKKMAVRLKPNQYFIDDFSKGNEAEVFKGIMMGYNWKKRNGLL